MTDNYYTFDEVVEKLGKSQAAVEGLIKDGKLSEYREEDKRAFQIEEVDALAAELGAPVGGQIDLSSDSEQIDSGDTAIELLPDDSTDGGMDQQEEAEIDEAMKKAEQESEGAFDTQGVFLEPDESQAAGEPPEGSPTEESIGLAPGDSEVHLESDDARPGGDALDLSELTGADTNIGTTGINVLADTDDDYKLADDTKGETKISDPEGSGDLGALDADLNMDSVGSGSGLLDLSLQADDTSLGAVLDDILPGGEADVAAADMGMGLEEGPAADEPELPEMASGAQEAAEEPVEGFQEEVMPPMASAPAAPGVQYAAIAPVEPGNGAYGVAMVLPFLLLVFAGACVFLGGMNVLPAVLAKLSAPMGPLSLMWYIALGFAVLAVGIALIGGSGGGGGAGKPKKAKTAKPKKEKKPKKPKKQKKK